MPKAKPDQVVIHRIEFQEREREMLEMIAASITAKNIAGTTESLLTPFFSMSVTSGVIFGASLGTLAAWAGLDKIDSTGGDVPILYKILNDPQFQSVVGEINRRLENLTSSD